MRLTKFTDNALRSLIYLSLNTERKCNISEIAEKCAIPRNHLVKVVNRLSHKGLVETSRGKGGGVVLARPSTEITVGEVVRAMEVTLEIMECVEPVCPILPSCKLRNILNGARDIFLRELDNHTVAELTINKNQLNHLIGPN